MAIFKKTTVARRLEKFARRNGLAGAVLIQVRATGTPGEYDLQLNSTVDSGTLSEHTLAHQVQEAANALHEEALPTDDTLTAVLDALFKGHYNTPKEG